MEHLSPDQLNDLLVAALHKVTIGGKYRHYKGQEYIVMQLAILEATDGVAVVYRAAYDERLSFVRPLSSWLENEEHNGKTVPRFTPL